MNPGTDSGRFELPETDFRRYMVGETDNRRYMVSCCFGRYTLREANVGSCTVRGACLAVRGAYLESGDGSRRSGVPGTESGRYMVGENW